MGLTVSPGESLFQFFVVLVVFILVMVITVYGTKWIAGYQKAQTFNKNLRIVETIKLSTNKYVQIIGAGNNTYFVVAVGKDEVTLLGTLSKDELRDIENSDEGVSSQFTVRADGSYAGSFSDILSRLNLKKRGGQGDGTDDNPS